MRELKLDEREAKETLTKKIEQMKKPRRIAVKNASFFLYEKEDVTPGKLIPIGSYQTEAEICNAHETALDANIPEGRLVGFKGRPLEFEVKETKRRITVR